VVVVVVVVLLVVVVELKDMVMTNMIMVIIYVA